MKNTLMLALLALPMAFNATAGDAKPEEKGPRTRTIRIVGLCFPDREKDLRDAVSKQPKLTLDSVNYARAEATFSYNTKEIGHDSVKHTIGARGFQVKDAPRPPDDKLQTLEIPIQILDCQTCCLGAYNSIARIDGVEQANIEGNGKVVAVIDPSKTNRDALVKALRTVGAGVPKSPEELEKEAQEKATKEAKEKEAKEKEEKEKAK